MSPPLSLSVPRPRAQRVAWSLVIVVAVVAWFVPAALVASAGPAAAEPGAGSANNPWPDDCNMRVGVVVDRSDSIKGAGDQNPALVRNAVGDLATRLGGTGASMAVWSFGTLASGYSGPNPFGGAPAGSMIEPGDYPSIGFTSLDDPGGTAAVSATVDAIPFTHTFNAATDPDTRRVGATNWEAGLGRSSNGIPGAVAPNGDRPRDADVLIFFTDGAPTVDNAQLAAGTPGVDAADAKVNSALDAAAEVKHTGAPTRIVAVGVGAVNAPNLERITGGFPAAEEFDDYWLTDFNGLSDALVDVANRICGGTLTLRKFVPGPTPGSWVPRPGWNFDLSFPNGDPTFLEPGAHLTTGPDGAVTSSWLDPHGASRVTIDEDLADGQRLGGVTCESTPSPNQAAEAASVPSRIRPPEDGLSTFTITVPRHQDTRCDVRNYQDGADLVLEKTADPEQLAGPGDVTFTLSFTNPDTIEPVRLDTLVDDQFGDLFDRSNPHVHDNTCDDAEPGTRVMPAGATATCSFVARVEPGPDGGPHVNVVTLHGVELLPIGGEGDPVVASDDATVTFTSVPGTDLAVAKDDGIETLTPGDETTYDVTVANHGDVEATGIVLTDHLPEHVTFMEASDGGVLEDGSGDPAGDGPPAVIWPWFGLAEGEERTVQVTVRLADDAADGTEVLNRVVVADDGTHGVDPTPDDNTATDLDHVGGTVLDGPPVVGRPADPPAGDLPRTGADVVELAAWAGALVAAGLALVGLSRRAPGGRLHLPLRLRRT